MTHTRKPQRHQSTYSVLTELFASPTAPMPAASRLHQLTRMWQGLVAMETATKPTTDDWRVVSDAVNLMETLAELGYVRDTDGLLLDAIAAMAMAGKRHTAGQNLRLDGQGIQAIRGVLEDYAQALEQLSHRTMVQCHRLTEKRIREILNGRKRAHDIEVVDL